MSRKPAKKSIVANFGLIATPASESPTDSGSPSPTAPSKPMTRVGAGIVGAAQRSVSEIREELDRLRAQVAAGGGLEIDPQVILPSPFPDRLSDDSDIPFETFKKLIADEGQQVPIGLRPHPVRQGYYQVVYGHRRWRAALELGMKVKAVVRDLSDRELVVAQGLENAAREDLTWIERSLFAWRMGSAGIRPRDIKAALAIDDAELARLRSVTRALPADLIEAIGRAPKAGRPRWTALAAAVEADPDAIDRIRKTLSADRVASSDDRFQRVLAAAVKRSPLPEQDVVLRAADGTIFGKAIFGRRDVRLVVEKAEAEAFASFLRSELPELMQRFATRPRRLDEDH